MAQALTGGSNINATIALKILKMIQVKDDSNKTIIDIPAIYSAEHMLYQKKYVQKITKNNSQLISVDIMIKKCAVEDYGTMNEFHEDVNKLLKNNENYHGEASVFNKFLRKVMQKTNIPTL